MTTALNVLIVEDSPNDAELLLAELRSAGFDPHWKRVETEPEFLAELQNLPELIISDYSMPHFSGLRAVELLQQSALNIPFLLISGTVGEDVAVEAMRRGATDYLLKDRLGRLGSAVERALEQRRLRAEQKQTEASLNLFRALVDRAHDSFEVVDPETGRYLDVNETGCRRLGYQREELLSMTVADIEVEAVDPSTWHALIGEVRRAGFKIFEGRHKRKDGSIFPVEVNVREVKLDRDCLVAAVRDITERVRTEQQLRESQALYHSLVDQMPTGIFRKDLAGRYVFVNPRFCELRGQDVTQIIGRTPEELAALEEANSGQRHPETIQLLRNGARHHEEILRTGKPIEVEEFDPATAGGKRHLHVVKSPVFDLEGQIVGTQGVQFDITERKEAEAEIQNQLVELQRWHEVTMGREDRILELKREVNDLLTARSLSIRYPEAAPI